MDIIQEVSEASDHPSEYQYDDELDDEISEYSEKVEDKEIPLEDLEIIEIDEKKIVQEQFEKIRKSSIFESFIPKEDFYSTPTKKDFKANVQKKKVLKKCRDNKKLMEAVNSEIDYMFDPKRTAIQKKEMEKVHRELVSLEFMVKERKSDFVSIEDQIHREMTKTFDQKVEDYNRLNPSYGMTNGGKNDVYGAIF